MTEYKNCLPILTAKEISVACSAIWMDVSSVNRLSISVNRFLAMSMDWFLDLLISTL